MTKAKVSYLLRCLECRGGYKEAYLLNCPNSCHALLRTEYSQNQLEIENHEGLFQYQNWLPVSDSFAVRSKPLTYHATQLGRELGLNNLYVSFNGYWPERGAYVESGSFKDYEAYPTLQRIKEQNRRAIQISSAGNTARAFANASAIVQEKVILVVPEVSKKGSGLYMVIMITSYSLRCLETTMMLFPQGK